MGRLAAAARAADPVRLEVRSARRKAGALQKHIILADEEAAAARAEAAAARSDAAMARSDAATMHEVPPPSHLLPKPYPKQPWSFQASSVFDSVDA